MIISVSRRTDIPAIYSDWFFNRIKEGYVLVRNPINTNRVSKVSLSPEVVDGIVFWTKNPAPMLNRLDELKSYPFYFQFTLNAYERDIECGIPYKSEIVIPAFQRLSDKIGAERVLWRYDPILISPKYTVDYHAEYFNKLAYRLKDYTNICTISFLDTYTNTKKNLEGLQVQLFNNEQKMRTAALLARIAHGYGLKIKACSEDIDLTSAGIEPSQCIDKALMEKIVGYSLKINKDRAQRPACGCAESIDIGTYGTCTGGCKYCYADRKRLKRPPYDPDSALLCDMLKETDIGTERKMRSQKILRAPSFFYDEDMT